MVVHDDNLLSFTFDRRHSALQTGPQPIIHWNHHNHHTAVFQVFSQDLESDIVQALHNVIFSVQGHIVLVRVVDAQVLVG